MKGHDRRTRRREAGFSFVELLVTIIIAGIAFSVMVPLFVQGVQASSGDKARAVALNVAQDRIEKLRQLDYELVTQENLNANSYFIGDSPNTWVEETETGQKTFTVAYGVTDVPVSTTDTRIAYKTVSVTVSWDGAPFPHRPVTLTTMLYRQYSGPQIVDFVIPSTDLAPMDPYDPNSERMIVTPLVHLQATVSAADLASMAARTIGSGETSRTVLGRVDFLITSSTGTAYPTISVPYDAAAAAPAVFPATWTPPASLESTATGAGDGYYTFKAVAFSSLGSPGNSWELTYRMEAGNPAGPRNLKGTAGLSVATLTWDASLSADVDHYIVMRDGVTLDDNVPAAPGSMGFTDESLTGPYGTVYEYTVIAVDWMDNQSDPVTLPVTSVDTTLLAPSGATDLQGQAVSAMARVSWGASVTTGVLGYQVTQILNGATLTFVTTTTSIDIAQGWNTTAAYQVKPYVEGNIYSNDWATILVGQTQDVDGWLLVTLGAEPRYTLSIKNTTNKSLTSLRMYYLGPDGTTPQVEITPAAANVAVDASHDWSDLAAGKYRWDWVTSNNKTGSQTATCSGVSLMIYGATP